MKISKSFGSAEETIKRVVQHSLVVAIGLALILGQTSAAPKASAATTDNPARIFYRFGSGATESIRTIRNDGSASSELAANANIDTRTIATDGAYLYFEKGATIFRSDLLGLNATQIVTTASTPTSLFVNSDFIYYTEWNGGVYRVAKVGGTPTSLITSAAISWGTSGFAGVTANAQNLFWSFYGAASGESSKIFKSSLDGTNPEVVHAASGVNSSALWLDGSYLYLGNSNTNGLVRVGIDGTSPTVITTGTAVRDFEVHGKWLYFTDGSTTIGRKDLTDNAALIENATTNANTVYAIAVVPDIFYSVTYANTGSTGGTVPASPISYVAGSTVSVLGNTGSLVKTGEQFAMWRRGVSSIAATAGSTFVINEDTILTPQWVGGPLEFSATAGGISITQIAFPSVLVSNQSTLTIYARNMGTVPLVVGNTTSGNVAVANMSGTCPRTAGGSIAVYNSSASPTGECTYVMNWTPSNITDSLSWNFRVPNSSLFESIAVTGAPVRAARIPALGVPVATDDGYTVDITNWDGSWTWVPTVATGSVSLGVGSGSVATLTISGLQPGAQTLLTIDAQRSGYASGSTSVTGVANTATTTTTTTPPTTTIAPAATTILSTTTIAPSATTSSLPDPSSADQTTPTSTAVPAIRKSDTEGLPITGSNVNWLYPLMLLLSGLCLLRITTSNSNK